MILTTILVYMTIDPHRMRVSTKSPRVCDYRLILFFFIFIFFAHLMMKLSEMAWRSQGLRPLPLPLPLPGLGVYT